ncbi:uncharacterized protein EMH_0036650 [Eimeria mitis]|uniref:Uncharacterized protein n=1 Tax=Eimeria mitis TaxID=44415 RepID=U6JV96_9EIME|nr:uncharacterized protein EMH_0036650 [Eimeria mitis]CDJ27987.1 hypothetical protein, conserved [Eimeria mitis]
MFLLVLLRWRGKFLKGANRLQGRAVIFLSMVCPVLFGFRSFMAFKGSTPPLHPLHLVARGVTSPQVIAGQLELLQLLVVIAAASASVFVCTVEAEVASTPLFLKLELLQLLVVIAAASAPVFVCTVEAEVAFTPLFLEGSFDSAIMAPLMQQNMYPFTPAPPHPHAQENIGHGPAMPSEVYPQFMHPQVPYRDSFSSYAPASSSGACNNSQYPQPGQRQ